MSRLLISTEAPDSNGCSLRITPQSAGWSYVGFEYYRLNAGEEANLLGDSNECCIVAISGKLALNAGNFRCDSVGKRNSPFEDISPEAVYIPRNQDYSIRALTDVEFGVCKAPAQKRREPMFIASESLSYVDRGVGANRRLICDIMMGNHEADSLLVVEVRTPSGHWSSYPPHKHDQDNLPHESYLEETYFHKLFPEQGYALQRVYNDDLSLNETIAVGNNQAVLVPQGYHPVGVPYGYESYYLNVMAGPKRAWVFKNDPRHEWILKK